MSETSCGYLGSKGIYGRKVMRTPMEIAQASYVHPLRPELTEGLMSNGLLAGDEECGIDQPQATHHTPRKALRGGI